MEGKTLYLVDINWGGPVAALLRDAEGFKTKSELSQWLADHVEKTVASFSGNGVIATFAASLAFQGLEPYATYMKSPPETLMKPFNAKNIQIVVVGGKIQTTWSVTDFRLGRGTLIDSWK